MRDARVLLMSEDGTERIDHPWRLVEHQVEVDERGDRWVVVGPKRRRFRVLLVTFPSSDLRLDLTTMRILPLPRTA